MNCSEFRERFDADPSRLDAESAEHLAACGECAEYAAAGRRFEEALADALKVPVPDDLSERAASAARGMSRRRAVLALAATVLLAAGAGVTWRVRERGSLERELLTYLSAWPAPAVIASAMATSDVNSLLGPASIEVDTTALATRVAKPCIVRGTAAVHLLIDVDGRLMSVIVMPEQSVAAAHTMSGDGLQGRIIPCKRGSLAIVGVGAMPSDALVEQVKSAVRYL